MGLFSLSFVSCATIENANLDVRDELTEHPVKTAGGITQSPQNVHGSYVFLVNVIRAPFIVIVGALEVVSYLFVPR